MLMSGFVDNYMIWNKHGEEEQPQKEKLIDKIMQEPESTDKARRKHQAKAKGKVNG